MRDISPSERAVLERAAEHVNVFERTSNKKTKPSLERGCFACEHPVGSLSPQGSFCTLIFYADYVAEPNRLLGVVVAPSDAFWSARPDHWFNNDIPKKGNSYPAWNFYYTEPAHIEEYGSELYVRLSVTPGEELRHTNSRLNLMDFMDEAMPEVVVVASPYYYFGIYVDPRVPYGVDQGPMGNIDVDYVRCTRSTEGDVLRQWGVSGGLDLREIVPKEKPVRTASKKKFTVSSDATNPIIDAYLNETTVDTTYDLSP